MGELLSQGPLFILCLIVMMSVVVIVHELGHYWMGRAFGAAVESYSVGFGKPIFERKDKHNTRWRVNWIPLGGFVKFVGEAQTAGDVGKVEQGPIGKPYMELGVGARSLVSIAGPLANFVLAALIYALIFGVHGRQNVDVQIVSLQDDMPAMVAGFQPDDVFVSVNGKPSTDTQSVITPILLNPNTPITVTVDRGGDLIDLTVTPTEVVRENNFGQFVPQATIGVEIGGVAGEHVQYNILEAAGQGVLETGRTLENTTQMLGRIITGKMSVHTMSGPVGIGDVSRRVVNTVWEREELSVSQRLQALFWMLLTICAAISVGIGFFNLLPLPVLDGGHLVFNAYEAITGKLLPEKVQEASLTFGLVLLLGMVMVITWGDIIETGIFRGSGS